MNDQEFVDYSRWSEFYDRHVQCFDLTVLNQMAEDLKIEITRRRTSDINEIEQGMISVVRPVINGV